MDLKSMVLKFPSRCHKEHQEKRRKIVSHAPAPYAINLWSECQLSVCWWVKCVEVCNTFPFFFKFSFICQASHWSLGCFTPSIKNYIVIEQCHCWQRRVKGVCGLKNSTHSPVLQCFPNSQSAVHGSGIVDMSLVDTVTCCGAWAL